LAQVCTDKPDSRDVLPMPGPLQMTPPLKQRKLEPQSPTKEPEVPVTEQLRTRGFAEFPGGVPWAWELFAFVDQMHAQYHKQVESRLENLQTQWKEEGGCVCRPGATAAEQVTKEMEAFGVAVYTPPPSQQDGPPWACTGPRFYVSVTAAAWKRWPEGAPAPSEELAKVLWPDKEDGARVGDEWPNLIRGLGWALAPPLSDAQTLHADICSEKRRRERVRFHHILWKRLPGQCCTTQLIPGGFTNGQVAAQHYVKLKDASAPCLLYDNEMLHRGAANSKDSWVSTCSIELCTRTGNDEVWKGGSEDDGTYKMLPICWSRQTGALPNEASTGH